MIEASMKRTWIYKMRQTQLLDSPKSLKPRMFNQIENQIVLKGNKSVNWVVNYLSFVGSITFSDHRKGFCKFEAKSSVKNG